MPESESEQREVQVNLTEAAEDTNPVSKEPKASYVQEGKPRSMTYYFQLYTTYCFYILMHLTLQELKFYRKDCMILGTYVRTLVCVGR